MKLIPVCIVALFVLFACSKPEAAVETTPIPATDSISAPVGTAGTAVSASLTGYMLFTSGELNINGDIGMEVIGANNVHLSPYMIDNANFLYKSDVLNEDATVLQYKDSTLFYPVSYPSLIQAGKINFIRKRDMSISGENFAQVNGYLPQWSKYVENIKFNYGDSTWFYLNKVYYDYFNFRFTYLANTTEYVQDLQPGDMRGINANGEKVMLQPYMMAFFRREVPRVEMAPNKWMEVTVPIPASAQLTAPYTAPLWMYDREKGVWREQGTATRSGGEYVFKMTRFGLYSVAAATAMVYLHAVVTDGNSQRLPYQEIVITPGDATAWPYSVFTDNTGEFSAYVPYNAKLSLKMEYACNAYSDAITVDPLVRNSWMTLVMQLNTDKVQASGTATDCDDQPMKKGRIDLTIQGFAYSFPVKDGKYAFSLPVCDDVVNASYTITDSTSNMTSAAKTVQLNKNVPNTIPVVNVCLYHAKQVTGDITYTVGGATYTLNGNVDSIVIQQDIDQVAQKPTTYMFAFGRSENRYLYFSFNSYTSGTYSAYTLLAGTSLMNYIMSWGYYSPGKIIVTAVDYKTGVLKGTFSSPISEGNDLQNSVPITGTFDLKLK